MIQSLNAPLSVWLIFDHKARAVRIKKILYDGTEYSIHKLTQHYIERKGRTLRHIFCVASEFRYFKLVLDGDSLLWTLEEIHDHDEN